MEEDEKPSFEEQLATIKYLAKLSGTHEYDDAITNIERSTKDLLKMKAKLEEIKKLKCQDQK